MENVLTLLKALADDTRSKIIMLLLEHNYCVGALARKLDLTEAAVSQHLKILREADLVHGEKQGYFVHYSVEKKQLSKLADHLYSLTSINRVSENHEKFHCRGKRKAQCKLQNGSPAPLDQQGA